MLKKQREDMWGELLVYQSHVSITVKYNINIVSGSLKKVFTLIQADAWW